MKKTDKELQLELAKMLPEKIKIYGERINSIRFVWIWDEKSPDNEILETEWLHVCWLIEQKLTTDKQQELWHKLKGYLSPSWQQRAEGLTVTSI